MNKVLAAVVFTVLLLSGCSSRPLVLTSEQDLTSIQYQELPRMKVSASSFIILGVIPVRFSSREVRARNRLLEISGGTDLINPSVSSRYFWTPIGPIVKFTLEATPIREKNNRS